MTDHLTRAKEYIAKGDEFYAKAADEIAAWLQEDASRTHEQAAQIVGRGRQWVGTLLAARAKCDGQSTEVDWRSGANTQDVAAARVLRDPEQRRQVIASLPAAEIEALARDTTEVAVERARAQRAEHQTTTNPPTAGDLMGGEKFDPSESWADTLIIRANRNLRELGSHTDRWGLVLGSMPIEEAFEYAQETERLAAEFRAAVQERIRDHAEV